MQWLVNADRPCIVFGLESQIGLGVVRELGRAGVKVIGLSQDPHAIGLSSRYLWRKRIVNLPRGQELLVAIRELGDEFGPCCLIAISEANLVWLEANRDSLGSVQPIVPPQEAMDIALNKQKTLQFACALGISTPETTEPTSMAEAEELAYRFSFPAVLKWKDPASVSGCLSDLGIALLKAEYVYSPEQFLAVAKRYEPAGRWPLVQSYCGGYGLGQFFYMHDGKPLRRFQHVRIAEWPPEGGFSSVCDSVPLTEHMQLQDKSIELLNAIGWEGVAMVEYRMDPVTGKAMLMEINGRYWGSFPLAVRCGAGFALIAYCLHNHLALPNLLPPREKVRCRMVATEIKRLVRILFRPNLIADRTFKVRKFAELTRFLADFFRPKVYYYVWSVTDPMPFIADVRNLLITLLARLAPNLIK